MSKPNNTMSIVRWLPLGLTLIGMIVAGSIAWGQQRTVTAGHDRRIQQNERVVRQLEKGQATILERTRQMYETQKEARAMQKEILRELRRQR